MGLESGVCERARHGSDRAQQHTPTHLEIRTVTAHAFLPPSGAGAWRFCSLWPTMNQRYPQGSTDESAEGDAAHWCNLQLEAPAIGTRAPNGVAVTDEMIKGRELWQHACNASAVYAANERTCKSARIHDALNTGTPDRFELANGCLTVLDYKFGHGQVEVFENWQLINYAALVLDTLELSDLQCSIRFVIVQPRGYHRDGPVRTWALPQAALLRGYWNQLRAAAELATDPARIKGTVGEHCKHCPGRHACEALQRNTLIAIDQAGSSVPLELSPEAIGSELRAVRLARKLMEARETGLLEQARSLMMQGQRISNLMLQESKGRERWKLPPEQIAPLGLAFGVAISKQEVLTPAQARAAGMPAEVVAALSEVPNGELRVVEDDGSTTRKLFGN